VKLSDVFGNIGGMDGTKIRKISDFA
jgi:hypothetical protein